MPVIKHSENKFGNVVGGDDDQMASDLMHSDMGSHIMVAKS